MIAVVSADNANNFIKGLESHGLVGSIVMGEADSPTIFHARFLPISVALWTYLNGSDHPYSISCKKKETCLQQRWQERLTTVLA